MFDLVGDGILFRSGLGISGDASEDGKAGGHLGNW
jgi:hypothetical protein